MPSPNDIAVFDVESARRIGKAVRRFEDMQLSPGAANAKQQFSLIEVFVPRSLADDIYTGDVYYYDPGTATLTLAFEDQTAEVLPDTL